MRDELKWMSCDGSIRPLTTASTCAISTSVGGVLRRHETPRAVGLLCRHALRHRGVEMDVDPERMNVGPGPGLRLPSPWHDNPLPRFLRQAPFREFPALERGRQGEQAANDVALVRVHRPR
jgi:hypothetical protein